MGGGCQCKKDCKIEVAYSAWQNANVKPVVAKMAFIFVAPTRHVQQSAVVIHLVSMACRWLTAVNSIHRHGWAAVPI